MIAWLSTQTALPFDTLAILALICFCAGLVRGFAGFALSALIMASAVMFLPPIELIPICWTLEIVASTLMFKGGLAGADKRMVLILFMGSFMGMPLGLWLTTTWQPETSTLVTLALILGLAMLQFSPLRIPGLNRAAGTLAAGVLAGVAGGIAMLGGMVIALFVLSRNASARTMRASLSMFVLISTAASIFYLLAYGVMDRQAALRGIVLITPTVLGVLIGSRLFIPRLEPWYRPFCLTLLICLAVAGLLRSAT